MYRSPWLASALWLAFFAGAAAQAQGVEGLRYIEAQAATQAGWLSAEAQVEAVRETVLSAQVPGALVALAVRAGDRVRADQELARIDARMAQQGAQASQAQTQAAEAQWQVAAREYERQQQLFAKRYISQAALDAAQARWQAAKAQVTAARAQAGVASTQTGLHSVQAPYDAVVAQVPVALGDMALPGRTLVRLYDPTALRITAQVPQAQAQQWRAGMPVEVEIAGQRRAVAAAQVQILPVADPQSHTVAVRVALGDAFPSALPGLFARLWWQAGTAPAQATPVLVPAGAVVRRAEMTGVYVRAADGKPQLRQVRLGQTQADKVEVLSGLNAGEAVAEQPQMAAKVR